MNYNHRCTLAHMYLDPRRLGGILVAAAAAGSRRVDLSEAAPELQKAFPLATSSKKWRGVLTGSAYYASKQPTVIYRVKHFSKDFYVYVGKTVDAHDRTAGHKAALNNALRNKEAMQEELGNDFVAYLEFLRDHCLPLKLELCPEFPMGVPADRAEGFEMYMINKLGTMGTNVRGDYAQREHGHNSKLDNMNRHRQKFDKYEAELKDGGYKWDEYELRAMGVEAITLMQTQLKLCEEQQRMNNEMDLPTKQADEDLRLAQAALEDVCARFMPPMEFAEYKREQYERELPTSLVDVDKCEREVNQLHEKIVESDKPHPKALHLYRKMVQELKNETYAPDAASVAADFAKVARVLSLEDEVHFKGSVGLSLAKEMRQVMRGRAWFVFPFATAHEEDLFERLTTWKYGPPPKPRKPKNKRSRTDTDTEHNDQEDEVTVTESESEEDVHHYDLESRSKGVVHDMRFVLRTNPDLALAFDKFMLHEKGLSWSKRTINACWKKDEAAANKAKAEAEQIAKADERDKKRHKKEREQREVEKEKQYNAECKAYEEKKKMFEFWPKTRLSTLRRCDEDLAVQLMAPSEAAVHEFPEVVKECFRLAGAYTYVDCVGTILHSLDWSTTYSETAGHVRCKAVRVAQETFVNTSVPWYAPKDGGNLPQVASCVFEQHKDSLPPRYSFEENYVFIMQGCTTRANAGEWCPLPREITLLSELHHNSAPKSSMGKAELVRAANKGAEAMIRHLDNIRAWYVDMHPKAMIRHLDNIRAWRSTARAECSSSEKPALRDLNYYTDNIDAVKAKAMAFKDAVDELYDKK